MGVSATNKKNAPFLVALTRCSWRVFSRHGPGRGPFLGAAQELGGGGVDWKKPKVDEELFTVACGNREHG